MFDPFFTTKDVGKGTGLVLSMVHGIIESHQGKIEVDSKEGAGTTISIYFPVSKEEGEARNKIEESEETIRNRKGNILLVEDKSSIAELFMTFLMSLGYTVTKYDNGEDAFKRFQSNPNAFDVVLTDMEMPGMTGKELTQRLLKIRSDIPVILSTGYSSLLSKEEALSIGARKFFMKPPKNLETLGKIIEECLNSH